MVAKRALAGGETTAFYSTFKQCKMKLTMDMCQDCFDSLSLHEKQWLCCFIQELDSARQLHREWPADIIHAAAVVAEESGELIRAALQYQYEDGQYYQMHKEAIHTAATCLRFLIELPEFPADRITKHQEG